MFIALFDALRRRGVPVTFDEWLTLQQALAANLADSSLERFYHLARAILVKNEAHYDRYDQAFVECFRDAGTGDGWIALLERELLRGAPEDLDPDRLPGGPYPETARATGWDGLPPREGGEAGADLLDGGGRRPRGGAACARPAASSGRRTGRAVAIASRRAFRNYRDDLVLDTRALKVALGRLRRVVREGPKDRLDLDATIDATCRNAGELELVWQRERRRKIRLLLLMDAGGTMTPHAGAVSRLFSAARDIVKELRVYYFHNCVYQDLYADIAQRRMVPTRKVLEGTDRSFKVILVGDAMMAPSELLAAHGAIDYGFRNARPGVEWLLDIRRRFRKAIWLNPEPERWWSAVPTTRAIGDIFPMYELTLSGLRNGARALVS